MKVWILGVGEYSDYGIYGIFSTEQKAKKVADAYKEAGERCGIDEWEVDDCENLVCKDEFKVSIALDTGVINVIPNRRNKKAVVSIGDRGYAEIWGQNTGRAVSYISEDHAIKLAVEFRQKFLRDGDLEIIEDVEEG